MINTACNLKCGHCAVFENTFFDRRRPVSSSSDISQVLTFAAIKNIQRVIVSGGEPTLSPWLLPVFDALLNEALEFSLSTNGTTIDSSFARRLFEHGLRKVTVSLDGARTITHEQLRGVGTFPLALRGATALAAAGVDVTVGVF